MNLNDESKICAPSFYLIYIIVLISMALCFVHAIYCYDNIFGEEKLQVIDDATLIIIQSKL